MRPIEFGSDMRFPLTACPMCNHQLDAATCTTGDHKPAPGDLTVCIECATILEFDPDLSVRVVGPSVLAALDDDTRAHLALVRAAIRKVNE